MRFYYYHIATKEYFTSEELQKRLNDGFEFICNECHGKIGNHVKTLAEGIFCEDCYREILEKLK